MVNELKDEAETTVKELLNRSTRQVQEQADAVVAESGEKLRASSQGFIDETVKHLSSVAETSLECLTTAATEQTREQLSQMLEEFVAKGTSLAQDLEKQKAELAAAAEDTSAALQSIQQRMVNELKDEAEMAVKDLLNRSTRQVQEQADAVVAESGEKLRSSGQGFIDETERHLSSVANGSQASMTKKDREESRDTVGIAGLEFTTEERQRIADLLEEARRILSKASNRQPNSAYGPKYYRQSAS
jgi:hypothetical protein